MKGVGIIVPVFFRIYSRFNEGEGEGSYQTMIEGKGDECDERKGEESKPKVSKEKLRHFKFASEPSRESRR